MVSISEIAKQHNLTASAIRYYESQGLINIQRDRAGNRLFDSKSEERIRVLSYLHQAGLSLSEMKDYVNHLMDHNYEVRLLQASRRRLENKINQLDRTLQFLDYKIVYHENSRNS
ncbi:MerR family transcriptional regulator [Oenococcus kitaharae]|uniref:MerR family transcriptional regulator n=1 Tax=Oenococcus kitaharae DSM 17330 TaxID=1045004 RepID=G9WEY5_9LACO|nr:MerR family transcriptional regulator [Oenococcus kitaharae]EHN58545.1 MerR family transcriptional regulator [Oenococcus kitaharae DSM 17330]MCV3296229.1 MerR family transcriptional regulator [Oenococcus kitaharae]OEY84738.1 transcriptional regulator [Oenococcus kitaharae]OEY85021.1 transcriptional regulator [Oenococcus kitaharae]OEY85812.1 transcriptional regulator [Oenococcus kitaharae]